MQCNKFHDSSFFYKEKILSLRPGVFQSISKQFTFIIRKELNVLIIKVKVNQILGRRILTIIKEKIIVDIFFVDSFSKEFIDLL